MQTHRLEKKMTEPSLNHVPDPLCVLDTNLRVVSVNHAWEETLGTARGPGYKLIETLHPRESRQALDKLEALIARGEGGITFECRIRIGYEYRDFSWNARMGDGRLYVRVQEADREAVGEARFRAFLDASPDLLFRMNRDGRYLDYIARDGSDLFIPGQMAIGRTARELLPAEIAEREMSSIHRALETGEMQMYEYRLPLASGPRDYEARVVVSGEGEVLVVVRDITEHKQAQEELTRKNEFINSVMESTSNSVWAFDMDGNFTFVSKATLALSGYQPDELMGQTFAVLFEPQVYRILRMHFQKLSAGQAERVLMEEKLLRKDGGTMLVNLGLAPIVHNDEITGVVASVEDITEKRAIEQQLAQAAKMATMGEMASGVAHELSQPLNVVKMAAQLIQDSVVQSDYDDEFLLERSGKIIAQVERAGSVINHLRVFSHKSGDSYGELEANRPLREAIGLLGQQLKVQAVQVTTDFAEDLRPVMGHQYSLEQVFINLLINARDALSELPENRPRRLDLRTFAENDRVIYEIANNGPRISDDVLERMFEPFYTTKEVGSGMGLGLSLSFGIIRDHRGVISARSDDNRTVFTIRLPEVRA